MANPGIKVSRRIQWVKEVTPGTAVFPKTAIWRGTGVIEDQRPVTFVPEDIGYASGVNRSYIPYLMSQLKLDAVEATFEQLPYLFEMGIDTVQTGVADGAGSGKIYRYVLPTTTPITASPKTYSVQAGDDQQMESAAYQFALDIHLSGTAQQAVKCDATLVMRSADPVTLTAATISFDNAHHILDSANGLAIFAVGQKVKASGTANNNATFTVTTATAGQLTVTENTATEAAGTPFTLDETWSTVALPAVENILFQNAKLYIDPVGGALGTTQATNTFLAFDLRITTGWKAQFTGDGNLFFSFMKFVGAPMMKVELDLTYEHNGTAVAEKAAARAQTPRQVRLQVNGSTLTTAGTKYSTKALRVDLAGKYSKWTALQDDNGNSTIMCTLTGAYDATAALFAVVEICNVLASLP